jgi:glycosyltransferase involved in cell wall biosynthesis
VNNNLVKLTIKYKLDILIYQLNNIKEIKALNKLKNINTVFYQHSSLFYELYSNYSYFYNLYKEYQKSKYIVSIIRYENDYLFNKWGIKSILMNNFVTFDYEIIIQSDLSTKTILMFGRANNKFKRFNLGILSMEYIKENIKECKMRVISNLNGVFILQSLVNNLDLNDKIEFVGYSLTPEINFKNVSLHIFPSISESFGLVLCETKLYGIPNILVGLNYISASNGGTIIIYDDSPESIARESIKILKNNNYKGNLGKEARISMKKFNNNLLLKNWIRLIITIYKYHQHYENLRSKTAKINQNIGINIIKSQIILLKKRKLEYNNMSINDFLNYSQLKKFLIKNN